MAKIAAIVQTNGATFPGDEIERVYRLRAGARGRGRILTEHRARGSHAADDEATMALTATARRLGYELASEFPIENRCHEAHGGAVPGRLRCRCSTN